MTQINNFEELECWKQARVLTSRIYKITRQNESSHDLELRKQIRKASISVMSNVAEGFERDGNREFINFLSIAKGSVGEIRAQLFVAKDQAYLNDNEFDELYEMVVKNGRVIGGLIKYLRQSDFKGKKFK